MKDAIKSMSKHIKGLADCLTETVRGKEDKDYNTLDFIMRGVISGIHWKAGAMAKQLETEIIPEGMDQLRAAYAAHKGDELSDVVVRRKTEFVKSRQYQLAHLQAVQAAVEQVWPKITDKPMYLPRNTLKPTTIAPTTDAMAEALALLGTASPGTEFNSEKARNNGAATH